jgi:hypothetical protein
VGRDRAEDQAEEILGALLKLDINLKSVGQELTDEGVETVERSYDDLIRALEDRRAAHGPQSAA